MGDHKRAKTTHMNKMWISKSCKTAREKLKEHTLQEVRLDLGLYKINGLPTSKINKESYKKICLELNLF